LKEILINEINLKKKNNIGTSKGCKVVGGMGGKDQGNSGMSKGNFGFFKQNPVWKWKIKDKEFDTPQQTEIIFTQRN
jgi:hypothetical protein